jgi:two-component system response regulator MprA
MRVLVVDDEHAVRVALERALRLGGHDVELAADGREGLLRSADYRPDVIVADLLMPVLDGAQLCRNLRARGDATPVLMLTARDGVSDRVAGLDAGADDYLVKPFAVEELLARLRALLRRTRPAGDEGRLAYAGIEMDLATRDVHRDGRPIELTPLEFALLRLLLEHPRQVLTRSLIRDRVWGFDGGETSNSLEVFVGYLRRKLEEGGEPRVVQTARGIGYALRCDDAA